MRRSALYAELLHEVRKPELADRFIILGNVPDAELPSLYAASRAFIYPSLYEGFGLPVLEAMACGTPVVAADSSALPDVAGGAALLINPRDPHSLIAALEKEGKQAKADYLRGEWEKKVKYFVYDDLYPFRSEYAFDRTAFESSYALAKYGATHDMAPDRNLWFDLKLKKWYSHPLVRREDSRAFMDRQLASGLVVRGWLNPAYYTLGCDPGVSYMAAMGGWGVLDYALNFAPRPFDWLQLGYASYLSSWCLMNTGRAATNFGFWYPGPENDGASGWQFQTAKAGGAWMGSSYPGGVTVPRGPWRYDGEIDLGYGGALRMAATIVSRDPVFGWFAYGGAMTKRGRELEISPRDGLRRRFHVVIPDSGLPFPEDIRRFKLELERDGFAADGKIVMDKDLGRIAFTVENRTGDAHKTAVRLSFPTHTRYELYQDGKPVSLVSTPEWDYPWRAELEIAGKGAKVELVRSDRLGIEKREERLP
jgi:hypothetical protein